MRNGKIILDNSGIPIVDYGYLDGICIGKQRNPVTISQTAIRYHDNYRKNRDNKSRELFLNCSNWLVDNALPYGNYKILEYKFPWPRYNLTPPWRSAMAQGQAIQVLKRAYDVSRDQKYLDTANAPLNSFFVKVKEGGVTYKTERDGWWYEEYASNRGKESRALNGMMYVMLGIYDHYECTGHKDAKYLFDQGVLALNKYYHVMMQTVIPITISWEDQP